MLFLSPQSQASVFVSKIVILGPELLSGHKLSTTIIAKIEDSELSSAANIGRHGLRRHFTQMKILQPKRIAFFPHTPPGPEPK